MATVVHCLDQLGIGGIQELGLTLHKHSTNQHVWWVMHGGDFEHEIRKAGQMICYDPSQIGSEISVLVGHTVGGWDYNEKFAWARGKNIHTVECMHSNANSQTKTELVDTFVGVSRKSVDMNARFKNAVHIYPPIDTGMFTDRKRTRVERIGRLSRLVPEKDPYTFAMVASLMPDMEFVVAGNGREFSPMADLKLRNMRMLGWVRDFKAFYDAIDLFLFPTRDECACASVAMAQAAGVPVICANISALKESTGGHAWFVDGGPQQYMDVVRYAAKHYEAFLGTAERGRVWAEENFGLLKTVGEWDKLVAGAESARRIKLNENH